MDPHSAQLAVVSHGFARLVLIPTATFVLIGAAICQTNAPYQVGTVMEVKDHKPTATDDSTKRYDISVKVGNTVYVVLYTPPAGSGAAEYKTGLDFPVQVDRKTLKFTDALGRPMRQVAADKNPARSE
jgi:hypothetical protein